MNGNSVVALLAVDVWEHAYYVDYEWKRPDYLKKWWNIVDWRTVERRWGEFFFLYTSCVEEPFFYCTHMHTSLKLHSRLAGSPGAEEWTCRTKKKRKKR